MQFTTALIASAAALTASALPQTTPVATGDRFGVITIRSGSEIQNSPIQAARGSLMVNAKSQNASCDAPTNSATFYINEDKELYLQESKSSYRPQRMFVDRSGMGKSTSSLRMHPQRLGFSNNITGQGKIGYLTGAQPLGRNYETKGWTAENNQLRFDGSGIQACPGGVDGSWSIWLTGLDKPGFLEGCVGVTGAIYKTENPIGCWYTEPSYTIGGDN